MVQNCLTGKQARTEVYLRLLKTVLLSRPCPSSLCPALDCSTPRHVPLHQTYSDPPLLAVHCGPPAHTSKVEFHSPAKFPDRAAWPSLVLRLLRVWTQLHSQKPLVLKDGDVLLLTSHLQNLPEDTSFPGWARSLPSPVVPIGRPQ